MKMQTNRRDLIKLPAAAMARSVIREDDPGNIKLSHRVAWNASDEDLLFLKQIGMRFVRAEFPDEVPLDRIRPTCERFAKYGISILSCAHYANRALNIQLGRPGRDRDIAHYRDMLAELGRAKIQVVVLDWHPGNTYTTAQVERRGYMARQFDLNVYRAKMDNQLYGREYSAEQMWDNFAYFLKAVLPAAEDANVKMAMHPDDPPIPMMHGVGRIFIDYEGYKRAEQLAGKSRHWGVRLCVGTWAEGGDRLGKDVFGMIRDFGGRGKIFDVDFRNVTSPLPAFTETFLDDGYLDMYQVMKALREVRYSGPMVPDHIPALAGDAGMRRAGTAYCIAYMRALLRRANEEVG